MIRRDEPDEFPTVGSAMAFGRWGPSSSIDGVVERGDRSLSSRGIQTDGRYTVNKFMERFWEYLPEYIEKWTRIALSTDDNDMNTAMTIIDAIYDRHNYLPPLRYVLCDAPRDMLMQWRRATKNDLAVLQIVTRGTQNRPADGPFINVRRFLQDRYNPIASVLGTLSSRTARSIAHQLFNNTFVTSVIFGNQMASDLCFVDFFANVAEVAPRYSQVFSLYSNLAKVCGWVSMYTDTCLISYKPVEIHVDDEGRLHNLDNVAILYRDGWGLYSVHGTILDEDQSWIVTEPDSITAEHVLNEENDTIREILLEQLTFDRYIVETGATLLQREDDYALYMAQSFDNETLILLSMIDPSTGKRYIRRVPPDITSVHDALAWSFDVDEWQPTLES